MLLFIAFPELCLRYSLQKNTQTLLLVLVCSITLFSPIKEVNAGGQHPFIVENIEKQYAEYEREIEKIKAMPVDAYKAYRLSQINEAVKNNEELVRARILVDVNTAEQVSHGEVRNSPLNSPKNSVTGADILAQHLSLDFSRGDKNKGRSMHVEHHLPMGQNRAIDQLVGIFKPDELKQLLELVEVSDVVVLAPKTKEHASMVTIHMPTGRMLPEFEETYFTREELKKNYYDDLMQFYETHEKSFLEIDFNWSDDYYADTRDSSIRLPEYEMKIDAFLSDFKAYDFHVVAIFPAVIVLEGNKELALAIAQDERVMMIRRYIW